MGRAIAEEDTDEIIRLVKEEGYDPSTRETSPEITRQGHLYENTYLNYAVSAGRVKSAETLLELGADIDAVIHITTRGSGIGNMNMAVRGPNRKMVDLLLKYHVDLNNPLATSPLDDMLMNEIYDTDLYELLLAHGANINHTPAISGTPPLSTAYTIKNMKIFHFLLEKGANPMQIELWGHSVASAVEEEIKTHSSVSSSEFLDEALALKQLLADKYGVQFPVEISIRRGIAARVARYDSVPQKYKDKLSEQEKAFIEELRHSLTTGVYDGIKLDSVY